MNVADKRVNGKVQWMVPPDHIRKEQTENTEVLDDMNRASAQENEIVEDRNRADVQENVDDLNREERVGP